MPRKAKYKIDKDIAIASKRAGIKALQGASEALLDVVAMYREGLKGSDKYVRIQSAQGLERLAARYDGLDIGNDGAVTVYFRGGVPQLGETSSDADASIVGV